MITDSWLPAKQARLMTIAVLWLALLGEASASFFAGTFSMLYAEEPGGVWLYRSAEEYRRQQGEWVGGAPTSVTVAGFLSSTHLKIKIHDTTTQIALDSLWGFRQGKHIFRVFKGQVYRLLAPDSIVVYRGTGKYHLKYYFSQGDVGDVYWFSKKKLTRVLAAHTGFVEVLARGLPIHHLLRYDDCAERFYVQRLFTEVR